MLDVASIANPVFVFYFRLNSYRTGNGSNCEKKYSRIQRNKNFIFCFQIGRNYQSRDGVKAE